MSSSVCVCVCAGFVRMVHPLCRTDGDDGKSKPKKKKHKSDTGKKSKRKASDGGEDYATL